MGLYQIKLFFPGLVLTKSPYMYPGAFSELLSILFAMVFSQKDQQCGAVMSTWCEPE